MEKISTAILGLGKMGSQIARRLHNGGFDVCGWNLTGGPIIDNLTHIGIFASTDVGEVSTKMNGARRIFWIMIPSEKVGAFLDKTLMAHLRDGDIVIDGGNSFYKDSIKRGERLKKEELLFLIAEQVEEFMEKKMVFL